MNGRTKEQESRVGSLLDLLCTWFLEATRDDMTGLMARLMPGDVARFGKVVLRTWATNWAKGCQMGGQVFVKIFPLNAWILAECNRLSYERSLKMMYGR